MNGRVMMTVTGRPRRPSRWWRPGCPRCGTPWSLTESHMLGMGQGSGWCLLCEPCHAELKPAERLPYYRAHWDRGRRRIRHHRGEHYGDTPLETEKWLAAYGEWDAIERAVLDGG